jgi:hypothetical protein
MKSNEQEWPGMTFSEILQKLATERNWAAVLDSHGGRDAGIPEGPADLRRRLAWWAFADEAAAADTRQFLDSCWDGVPETGRGRLKARIENGDEREVEAGISELVTHEFLRRLGRAVEWGPRVRSLTPDLAVSIDGQTYFLDVYVRHNPEKTVVEIGPDYVATCDRGERARELAQVIISKARKYAATQLPLLLVVFLGDHWVRTVNVEEAVYGIRLEDLGFLAQGVDDLSESTRIDSVFFSETIGVPRNPNLSAVVVFDWFDTLNRENPGKRLDGTVLHHWKPFAPMACGAFGSFPEVVWHQDESGIWQPEFQGPMRVARFLSDGGLEFDEYTEDQPW